MAEARNVHVAVAHDDPHTLTYLKVISKEIPLGPKSIESYKSMSTRDRNDTLKTLQTQQSESRNFAMQNHLDISCAGAWWKANATHNDQYEQSSSYAKQTNRAEQHMTDNFQSMSLKETYELKEGEVYVETVTIKCHKITVAGKDEVHCIHYPAQAAIGKFPLNREGVLKLTKSSYLDLETWRTVFDVLGMGEHLHVCFRRNQLEEKLKAKVYKSNKKGGAQWLTFNRGDRADCFYTLNGKYYTCTIESANTDGTYNVTWDDGDKKDRRNHPKDHFKPKESAKAKPKQAKPKPKIRFEIAVHHAEDWFGSTTGGNYTLKKNGKLEKSRNFGDRNSFFNWLELMRKTELRSGFGVSKKGPWRFTATQGEWESYWRAKFY